VPDIATANALFIRKTIASESLLVVVDRALETVGGGGIFRSMGLERLVRDMHAAQFHPLQTKRQHRFTGRAALGLEPPFLRCLRGPGRTSWLLDVQGVGQPSSEPLGCHLSSSQL